MLFWGWGGKRLHRTISESQAVVLAYRYVHLMCVFTWAFKYQYLLATATDQGVASRPVTDAEARILLDGQELRPNLWQRYSFGLLPVVVVLVLAGSALKG